MDVDEDELNEIAMNFHRSGNLSDGRDGDEEGVSVEIDPSLSSMSVEDLLKDARKHLLIFLLNAVKTGMATPQEMAVLRALLKDNGMVMGFVEDGAGEQSNTRAAQRPIDLPTFQSAPYDLQ